MYRIIRISLAALLAVAATACGGKTVQMEQGELTPEQQQGLQQMREMMQRQQQMSQEALQRQMGNQQGQAPQR